MFIPPRRRVCWAIEELNTAAGGAVPAVRRFTYRGGSGGVTAASGCFPDSDEAVGYDRLRACGSGDIALTLCGATGAAMSLSEGVTWREPEWRRIQSTGFSCSSSC